MSPTLPSDQPDPRPAAEPPQVHAAILTAQMRRDRDRLADAESEILALREQIRRLQGMPAHRVLQGALQAYRALPPGLRGTIRRLRGDAPAPAARPAAAVTEGAPAAAPASRGRAIIIDDHWPQPDRDAGSVDIVHLAQALRDFGFETILAAAREHAEPMPSRDALVRAGIRCLMPSDAPSVEDYLARHGHELDLCVLCRVYCGGRFLEPALRDARHARVVFNTIDLNFLREERRARLMEDEVALAVALQVRQREEQIIRASDATIVVSKAELEFLASEIPDSLVVEMPLARPLAPPATPFAARAGIGFIGGFAHAPNVDAVRYFLAEIWPLVLRELPELEFTIVGADFPAELLEGAPGRVRALGHLPEIGPWFEGLRLSIAPLRFGAGTKGKVASSLAAGVPCIATPVAAEGMSLSEDSGVLVAADPAGFASRLCEAYSDELLWNRLSIGGVTHAQTHLSITGWRDRLEGLLRQIGF
jgi:glycosyltransferase involved in cell wall biosynthesis